MSELRPIAIVEGKPVYEGDCLYSCRGLVHLPVIPESDVRPITKGGAVLTPENAHLFSWTREGSMKK